MKSLTDSSDKILVLLVVASVISLLSASAIVDFVRSADTGEVQLSGDYLAAEPRADISDNGSYLAAVWVEANPESSIYSGDAMLRRAVWNASEDKYVWDSAPVTVFDATGGGKGYLYVDIDIQYSSNVAHVAAAFQSGTFVRIAYKQCNLSNSPPTCGTDQNVFSLPDSPYDLSSVQVAASGDLNKPYIVFARNDGKIYYVRWDTSNTSPIPSPNVVSEDDAYRPQMVYTRGTDNYVHFLWEKRLESQETGYPLYRRCEEGGSCSDPIRLDHKDNINTYPSPFLAVHAERILAGWQRCDQGGGTGQSCSKFTMHYVVSDDAGQSLIDYGDNPPVAQIGDTAYAGTDSTDKIYRARLQPSMAFDQNGYPYVAWQVSTDSNNQRHTITTTVAMTETASGFEWEQAPGMEIRSSYRDYVKPFILLPSPGKEPGNPALRGVHLFYMKGDDGEEPAYKIYYTYLHETDPNATPEPTGETGEPTGEPTDDPDDNNDVFLPLIMRG